MRYFLVGFAVLFAVSAWAADASYNESVAAISYNPSRSGAYSHLKIVKSATVSGINATDADVNIGATGAVRISGGPDCTGSNACHQIEKIAPLAGDGCTNSNYCDGNTDANFVAKLQTDSGTLVHGGSTPYLTELPSISADSGNVEFPAGATGTNLELAAGTLTAGDNSKAFVKNLDATLTNLHLKANTLIMKEGKKFEVKGATPTFKVGKTSITAGSKNGSSLIWKECVDDDNIGAKILAIQ